MTKLHFPSNLEDKIFEIKFESNDEISEIVSYFPLSESETKQICSLLNKDSFIGFHSIFTDRISEEEWSKTKEQIKRKFRDELFEIDKKL